MGQNDSGEKIQVEEMRNGLPGRRSSPGKGTAPLLSNLNGTGRGMGQEGA